MLKKMKVLISIAVMILTAIQSGCSLAPEYKRPELELPSVTESVPEESKRINIEWWKNFDDESLNSLIHEALDSNDDLKLAAARVDEAEARLGFVRASLYPTITADTEVSRSKISEEVSHNGMGEISNNFLFSGLVSYEIDLRGKIRNQKKTAISTLLASKAVRDAIQISLVSNVATTYFNIISLELQINTTEEILQRYQEIYEFRLKQFKHGLIDELIPHQAKAQYETTKVLLEDLREQRIILMSSLSMLLGRSPKEIFANNYSLSRTLPEPIEIPPMLPSKLLDQRPDIIQSEEKLKAANLQIGVARAAYFPSISLTGVLGFQSEELKNLFQSSAKIWSIGSNIAAPLISFDKIRSNVKITEARQKQALIEYVKTVKIAFKEVYDAFERIEKTTAKLKAQQAQMEAMEKVLSIATKRYERGLAEYITVLDAQRGYLSTQLNLISLKTELLNDQVLVFKALGGGWHR